MIRLLKGDDRYVAGYLNFSVPAHPDPLVPYGPTDGEYPMNVWAVEVSEDGKRVGYSFIGPGEDA